MSLKKNDQIMLDQLQQFANVLAASGQDFATIKQNLRPSLKSFEDATDAKVSLREENGAIVVSAFDLKKDDVRTLANKEKTLISMRAKVLGVPLDVKVLKSGVQFTNGQISEALREAADLIDRMPVQMADRPESTWNRETGEPVETEAGSYAGEDDSQNDEEPLGEEQGAQAAGQQAGGSALGQAPQDSGQHLQSNEQGAQSQQMGQTQGVAQQTVDNGPVVHPGENEFTHNSQTVASRDQLPTASDEFERQ